MTGKILLTAFAAASATLSATGMSQSVAEAADTTATSEITAEKCFVVAPPEVFAMVDPNTRLDMIDYYKAGIERMSDNSFGGKCAILSMEPQSLTLQGGDGISYQFFVVEGRKRPYIGLIETLSIPADDSSVRFFTSDWTPAGGKGLFREPTLKDWMDGADRGQLAEAERTLPFVLVSYAFDPGTQTLTATNRMRSYYHPSDTPEAVERMKPSITYKWDARREAFVMEKK